MDSYIKLELQIKYSGIRWGVVCFNTELRKILSGTPVITGFRSLKLNTEWGFHCVSDIFLILQCGTEMNDTGLNY